MSDESPRIVDDGWGYVEVQGVGRLRDAKLWPGGGRSWDWNETGTAHQPGIQPSDVAELLEHQPGLVILSRGRQSQLGVCPETLSLLEERGIAAELEPTATAIERFNAAAADGLRPAALIHTTC